MPGPELRQLPREHITQTLQAAVMRYPLAVLTAPMGYGKTVAARALLRHLGFRIFYLTVNPGMHNALYLWDRMCNQLQEQGSPMAPTFRKLGFPQDSAQLQRLLEQGKAYLGGRPTLMVIDDYHFAHAPECDNLLELLTREQIPGLRLLMLSRTRPALHLDELQVKGLAVVFDQDLLTFSEDDAVRYFQLNGIENAAVAQEAWTQSEGWAASLWLCLQNYRTTGLLAPGRGVEGLLNSAVFSQYDREDQRLLAQLSVLDSFTPRQAAAVSGDEAAPRRLLALHERNAFLRYDPATDTYWLHSLFRAFLGKMLAEADDVDKALLHTRAGEWHAAGGDIVQALCHFDRAGTEEAFTRVLELFEQPSDGLVVMFDPDGVKGVFGHIPWAVRFRRPIGYLAFIYHYMSRVHMEEGLAMLQEATARFAREKSIPAAMQRRIKGEAEVILAIADFNDLFAMRERYIAAHRLLQGRSAISHRNLVWTFGNPHAACLYLRKAGSYADLVQLVKSDLHYYQELSDGCSMGAKNLFRGEYLLETGRLKEVEPYLVKSVYRASGKEQLATIIGANFSLARLFLAEGEAGAQEKVRMLLDDLAPQVERAGHPILGTSFDLCRGYIHGCLGNHENIPGWLQRGEIANMRSFYQGLFFSQIVHGKALLLHGDFLRLEILAQDLPASLKRFANLFGMIHAFAMQAAATQALAGPQQALPLLREAVRFARPDHILLSLAEYGRFILPTLRLLQAQARGDAYIAALAGMTEKFTALTRHGKKKALTGREKEIMGLVAQGKSNPAVAEELGLKPITVGKALTNIYAKLGVKNRAEAVRMLSRKEIGNYP